MSLFMWKKSYEIKVAEIDLQHRRLVGLINELSDAMMVRQGHRAVPFVLEELLEYTRMHFSSEEDLMRRTDFPGLDKHRGEHLEFSGQVMALRKRYADDQNLAAREVLGFLCDWLKHHIIVTDKQIGAHIRRIEPRLVPGTVVGDGSLVTPP